MKTQRTLDVEKVKEFVGDFNKLFDNWKEWTEDVEQIRIWRKHFWRKYPEILSNFSENEVEMETEVESRPAIDREKKLREVEERLLSKRTTESFTDYEGVIV